MALRELIQTNSQRLSHYSGTSTIQKSASNNTRGTRAMSRMLIGDYYGLPGLKRTAEWSANHDQLATLYKGSIFICINAIASKIASMGIKVMRRRYSKAMGSHLVHVSHEHPLVELLNAPNPKDTAFNFHATMVAWWLLSGNAYFEKWKNGFGTVTELWPVSPQFVRVIPDSDHWIQGYRVSARYFGAAMWDVPFDEMVHVKAFGVDHQGTQRFYGHPTSLACEAAVELENEMFARERHRFSNYAEPGLILGTDQKIGSEHQLKQLVHTIWSQHRVAEQSGVPMVLHSGMKLLSNTKNGGSELNYTDSLLTTLKFIAATFQLPLEVVGLNMNASRASAQASLKTYAENCINPRCIAYGQALTQGLAKDFEKDLEIQVGPFDVADMVATGQIVETLGRIGGITPNEARRVMLNLPPLEVGGNTPVLQAGVAAAPFGNDADESNDEAAGGGYQPQNMSLVGA